MVKGTQQKERQKQDQNAEEIQQKQTKRKVIKKFPFHKKVGKQDDDLRDWKPQKIVKKDQEIKLDVKDKKDLANQFLSSLSKPVSKFEVKQTKSSYVELDQVEYNKPIFKKPLTTKLTPQQIKWDIQDQTFIQKKFIPKSDIEQKLQEKQYDDEQPEQIIKIKGNKEQKSKVRHIDLTKIINADWQEVNNRKNIKNQLWEGANGVLEGRGILQKIAKQAVEKANDIDDSLHKRNTEKNKMKSRYGW